jgi:CBS domain-containing protein
MIASEVMDINFHCLHPENTIAEAVRSFKVASDKEGKKIFGMMVTDNNDHLVGMLSMYDILLFIQPKHVKIWGEMEDLDPGPLFDVLLNRVKNIRVEDIMTTDIVTVKPDTHLFVVIEIMIKKHIRRLPIVEEDRIAGIVYRSDVFYYLLSKFME